MIKPCLYAIGLSLLAAASPTLAATRASSKPAPTFGDASKGRTLFLQCRACHTVGQGEAGAVGPNLWNVVGAKAAAKPDFRYSAALKSSGLVWTPNVLSAWLEKPTSLVPGTTMAFAGVAAPQARADLIAYLATLAPGRSAH